LKFGAAATDRYGLGYVVVSGAVEQVGLPRILAQPIAERDRVAEDRFEQFHPSGLIRVHDASNVLYQWIWPG